MKKTIVILLSILFVIGVCSCDMRGQKKVDRMVEYINNKYTDDKFEYEKMTGGYLGSNVTKIIVSSEKYPEKDIYVICTQVDDEEKFTDTYLNVKFEIETEGYIKNSLNDIFGDSLIWFSYSAADIAGEDKGSSLTTFMEYLANENTYISFSALIDDVHDDEVIAQKLQNVFADAVISGHLYFVKNCENNVDYAKAQEYMQSGTYERKLYFSKQNISDTFSIEWTDGI